MPNWIEGTMKLRGKMSDIKRFFDEGIELSGILKEQNKQRGDYIKENCLENELYYEIVGDTPHVIGTHRMFIAEGDYYLYKNDNDNNVMVLGVQQAWTFTGRSGGVDEKALVDIADKYNLDIRLYGIEQGMEFCQEVIVHHKRADEEKGEIVVDSFIKYEDWDWECPFPRMGG